MFLPVIILVWSGVPIFFHSYLWTGEGVKTLKTVYLDCVFLGIDNCWIHVLFFRLSFWFTQTPPIFCDVPFNYREENLLGGRIIFLAVNGIILIASALQLQEELPLKYSTLSGTQVITWTYKKSSCFLDFLNKKLEK